MYWFLASLIFIAASLFFIHTKLRGYKKEVVPINLVQPCLLKETSPTIVPYEYQGLDIHNQRWRNSFIYKASSGHKVYEVTIPKRDLNKESRLITVKIILEDDIKSLEQDY